MQVSDQGTRSICPSVLVGEFVVVIDVLRLLQIVVFPPFMLWWFVYILKDYDDSGENGAWACLVVCKMVLHSSRTSLSLLLALQVNMVCLCVSF